MSPRVAYQNFAIYSEHVPGVDNPIADLLSRLQTARLQDLAADAYLIATLCSPLSDVL